METRSKIPLKKVVVGMGTCGLSAGAEKVFSELKNELEQKNLLSQIILTRSGCKGMCYNEVLIEIQDQSSNSFLYKHMTPEKIKRLVEDHLLNNQPITDWIIGSKNDSSGGDIFFKRQNRLVLSRSGTIDPYNIEEYLSSNGYRAAEQSIFRLSPEDIVDMIKKSGLRGRGGGGFSTGRKWETAKNVKADQKFVICNADEGDPGAFMDRSLCEGDPHSIIEGMIIGAKAIGATCGIIYIRAEYPLAVEIVENAVAAARKKGFLGKKIFGTKMEFDISLVLGAGSFVCGESSALVASVAGLFPEPRAKYIHLAEHGLFNKPTVINNVETWANVPLIMNNGSDWFRNIGTKDSPGTKIFALVGNVNRTGLVEVPMGMPLREIIYDIGGGIAKGRKFKAVQTGGPSGGCIPEKLINTPVDFDRLTEIGSMMGSGGMIVLDDTSCMVSVAKYFIEFLKEESCGKCAPCRDGLYQLGNILSRITSGQGKKEDLEKIEDLCTLLEDAALCGLGKSAANPVRSTLRYFREEYDEHILHKKCRAGACKDLISIQISKSKCTGCGVCLKICPVTAIKGTKKEPHIIEQNICSRCRACLDSCKFAAIEITSGHQR